MFLRRCFFVMSSIVRSFCRSLCQFFLPLSHWNPLILHFGKAVQNCRSYNTCQLTRDSHANLTAHLGIISCKPVIVRKGLNPRPLPIGEFPGSVPVITPRSAAAVCGQSIAWLPWIQLSINLRKAVMFFNFILIRKIRISHRLPDILTRTGMYQLSNNPICKLFLLIVKRIIRNIGESRFSTDINILIWLRTWYTELHIKIIPNTDDNISMADLRHAIFLRPIQVNIKLVSASPHTAENRLKIT